MKNLFSQILNRFYFKDKFKFYFLILMSVIAGGFEYIGLVLIYQFILFILNPNAICSIKLINFYKNFFAVTDFNKITLITGLTIAFIYIFKNIFMLLYVKFNNLILEDLSIKITMKMFKNILFCPYLQQKKIEKDEKLNIITKINLVVFQYCYKFITFLTNSIISFVLICYLFIKFTKIAFIAGVFLFVLSTIEYFYLKTRSNYQNKNYTTILDKINKTLITIINSTIEIKLNNKEEYFLSLSKKQYKSLADINKDRNFNTVVHIYFTEIFVMLSFILVFIILHFQNYDNALLITSLSTICVIILRLTPNINRAQSALYAINSNKKAVVDLIEFDEKFKNTTTQIAKEKLPFNDSIKLKNVNFSYDDKNFIKNVNLEIKKNDFISIVGKSGNFKTTLSLIISGLIEDFEGEILIDNIELKDDLFKKWQNNIAFLSQDFTFLFDEIDKILDFKDEKVKDLIKKMNLKNIENKTINELSTGEKQRIALINILLQDKNVIILDEATSNIDTVSQNEILKILNTLKNEKTIISITHRLETLQDSSKIIFINDKKELFFDTFENLKSNNTDFKKMIETPACM